MAWKDGGLLCDVCKEPMAANKTVTLRHRDKDYEVDLCDPHVMKLDRVLTEFIAVGREGGPGPK
jgi:hypothetical protein